MNLSKQIVYAYVLNFCLLSPLLTFTWPHSIEHTVGCFVHPLRATKSTFIQFFTCFKAGNAHYPHMYSLPITVGIAFSSIPYFFLSYSSLENKEMRALYASALSTSPSWRRWFLCASLLKIISMILKAPFMQKKKIVIYKKISSYPEDDKQVIFKVQIWPVIKISKHIRNMPEQPNT